MSTRPSQAPAPRPAVVTALWAAVVLALSAAAWLAWLSWADDRPELAAWQIAGVVVTLLSAVAVGVLRLGALRAWMLSTVPFSAFGAHSLIGSDPLGLIGAGVWIVLVVLGVSAMVALVVGCRVLARTAGRGAA